jgi:hypothetical protein
MLTNRPLLAHAPLRVPTAEGRAAKAQNSLPHTPCLGLAVWQRNAWNTKHNDLDLGKACLCDTN